jgi:integrase
MGSLDEKSLKRLLTKPPARHADGQGLFFKTTGKGKAYFVARYTIHGTGRETSLGPFPELTLDQARIKHLRMLADIAEGRDPVAERQKGKAVAKVVRRTGATTFSEAADAFLDRQDKRGKFRNLKHRWQWGATLAKLPASFRDLPVDDIGPQQVFDALDPIWSKTPETASRLRGRIAVVIDSARRPDDTRANPAAWSGWLKDKLGSAKELGKIDRKTGERVGRGHHAAMDYRDLPQFMARLTLLNSVAARALEFTILTAARSGEVFGATFDEMDFDERVWTVPAKRMKMKVEHNVPLSDPALAILRLQRAVASEKNPHVFPGARPMQKLSNMAMSMAMRRLGAGAFTVHGFRISFRNWAAKQRIEFEIAEACLAHQVGNAVTRAYLRDTVLENRRPVMTDWADYVTGQTNVVQLRSAVMA